MDNFFNCKNNAILDSKTDRCSILKNKNLSGMNVMKRTQSSLRPCLRIQPVHLVNQLFYQQMSSLPGKYDHLESMCLLKDHSLYQWKSWRATRLRVLELDAWTCQTQNLSPLWFVMESFKTFEKIIYNDFGINSAWFCKSPYKHQYAEMLEV